MFRPMHRIGLNLFLGIALMLVISGCSQIIADTNWILPGGQTINGHLLLPSANAILEENSRVTGSTVMLCCNLIVDGEIDGNILVVSGNLQLGPHAIVGGDVDFISGNEDGKPGAVVRGKTWHLGQ